ncbi:MAG TPA: citrate synthase [Isosphaeraceae bacterium]
MNRTATLTCGDLSIELPVIQGSEGELALDLSSLRDRTGLITLDPGFANTATCQSAITFIDGENGILRYRGIPIELLAQHSSFIETAWLLIYGRLPSRLELDRFRELLAVHAPLHEAFRHHYEGFPVTAPPMAILSAMINTLACFQPLVQEPDEPQFAEEAARLISKVRTIAAYTYRRSQGLPAIYPDPKLSYVANFLHMMFSMPFQQHLPSPEVVRALDLVLLLHADHEQGCSTTTVRLVGSSRANLFASCAAGVGSLWGPVHGGANVAVIEMLEAIHQGRLTTEQVVARAKDPQDGFRLVGFGHRIYKHFDPRARLLQQAAEGVLGRLGRPDPLLDVARGLEERALQDPYFLDRRLYPNADFYSGILMRALGIPTTMFPVLFAIGRMPGWIAHWKEQHDDRRGRIARPRQVYTGPRQAAYVPMEQR